MALRSDKNEYRGVNAHLHSAFQQRGGWEGFHNKHVGDLGEHLSAVLPPGYLVDTEQSLQIRGFRGDMPEQHIMTRPDAAVYHQPTETPATTTADASGAVATLSYPLVETLVEPEEDDYLAALLVYRVDDSADLGQPILRLELLSPTNKQGYGLRQYREKRIATLKSGLRLVEIDYLHELPSPIPVIPRYPTAPDSFAYSITISDPRPSFARGSASTFGFGVDDPIPALTLPLSDSDTVRVDFNAVYHLTFGRINAYSYRVDYADLPAHFDSYSAADQARIRQRMADVKQRLGA